MIRRPPRSTRTDTLFPYTTLFRSSAQIAAIRPQYVAGIFGRNPVNRSATEPSMAEASPPMAPEWTVSRWFNADGAPSLQSLRGRVVFLHALQMLCPACVHHAVPQSLKVAAAFASHAPAVVGLPNVGEHPPGVGPPR